MKSLNNTKKISALVVFLISFVVYIFSVERTGSLWDCGEFVLGAMKLQVVHPPGAALFMMVGRIFAWIAEIFSDNPSNIAFFVNLMSGLLTAITAALAGVMTIIFGKIALVGKEGTTTTNDNIALCLAGVAGGLSTAFASSIWFSAVEGEVYAMSTFFTALTFWSASHWYELPDDKQNDRWLVFSLFAGGLSVGVHLLSILTYPAIGLLYYFKKYKEPKILGAFLSMGAGIIALIIVMKVIVVGIPTIWQYFEIPFVNDLGMPVHSGLIPTIILLAALFYFLLKYASKKGYHAMHLFTFAALLTTIAFSTIGVIVIRANADTPVNMNTPSDVTRLIPYLNREQYGERALVKGPHYMANYSDFEKEDRYGLVDGKYEIVDEKYTLKYNDRDKILFPRISHNDQNRVQLHNYWRSQIMGDANGVPGMAYNLKFMWEYQLGWMYWRYFMWNFVGKQNGSQGFFPWDLRTGHWESGIPLYDEAKLYNMDQITDTMRNDPSTNKYYFLPLIFGILGLVFLFFGDKKSFITLLVLFLITGIGIVIYSNQPPNEPRERDYVLVGSFMTWCMFIGMGVLALYDVLKTRLASASIASPVIAGVVVLSAPLVMAFQNYDDHSRMGHYAARDYASNFLNSVDENAIIFTYGDNDTYPLWYAQEVEGIRTDVRVVNLSLLQVDWYINKLRSKVNESPAINLTLKPEDIRGRLRNSVIFADRKDRVPLDRALEYIADSRNLERGVSVAPSRNFNLIVDENRVANSPLFDVPDGKNITNIPVTFAESKRSLVKDELAILDILSSNFYERPIYFAVTCQPDKLLGLNDYLQLEGLALRVVPWQSDSEAGMGIYGFGMVRAEKVYDNVMNKWKWGNFDQFDTYVNDSYNPGVNAMKMALVRAGNELLRQGKVKEGIELANQLFESFPHFNFPYDNAMVNPINILVRGGDFENAKKHIRILATETQQKLAFYDSLDPDDLSSFAGDMRSDLELIPLLTSLAASVEDPDFQKEITDMLAPYRQSGVPN